MQTLHVLQRRFAVIRAMCVVLVSAFIGSVGGELSAQSRTPPANKNMLLEKDFIYGVNLPWFDGQYDHDLGPNPQHPDWGVWYDQTKVSRYFGDIRSIGFQVVRVWLMERAEGLLVDKDGIITGLHDTFLTNLDDLVERARDQNLRLYLCLSTTWGDVKYPSPVVSDKQQAAYLERAVKPLVKRLRDNKVVFAIDVFNEIESEVRDDAKQKATIAQARNFIRNSVQAVKAADPKRLVSAGSGWHGWKPVQDGQYKGLGLDFYDIHVYSDDGYLPHVRELNVDKPVIVGECGQAAKRDDDEVQRKAVTGFLRNASAKGYAGCFVWAYGPKEKYFNLVRDSGEHRPVVGEIKQIINGQAKPDPKHN